MTLRISHCEKCGIDIQNVGRGPVTRTCKECKRGPRRRGDTLRGKGKCIDFLKAALASNTDDCILWPFSCAGSGYGQFGWNGDLWKAHVWVCTQTHGPRPDGRYAAHSCHKQKCVNPRHVSWKTNSENMLDKRENGTVNQAWWGRKGKLTPVQAAEILALKGKTTHRKIAAQFGVTEGTIRNIHAGRNWGPRIAELKTADETQMTD